MQETIILNLRAIALNTNWYKSPIEQYVSGV